MRCPSAKCSTRLRSQDDSASGHPAKVITSKKTLVPPLVRGSSPGSAEVPSAVKRLPMVLQAV
ncbi:hypothetical protein BJF79_28140 [Actinomadura sp. CNU-125]|nr:hypothetical protein BJF79_28140 [Actinomadura sp. CNU-125]